MSAAALSGPGASRVRGGELANAELAEGLELLADLVRAGDRPAAVALATTVLASLAGSGAEAALVDAATVAARLGRSPAWVRANAGRLGAVRLGDGPRPRLAFDLELAVELASARPSSERAQPSETPAKRRKSRASSRRRSGTDADPGPERTRAGALLLEPRGEAPCL